jgi:hypothetical protein
VHLGLPAEPPQSGQIPGAFRLEVVPQVLCVEPDEALGQIVQVVGLDLDELGVTAG